MGSSPTVPIRQSRMVIAQAVRNDEGTCVTGNPYGVVDSIACLLAGGECSNRSMDISRIGAMVAQLPCKQ